MQRTDSTFVVAYHKTDFHKKLAVIVICVLILTHTTCDGTQGIRLGATRAKFRPKWDPGRSGTHFHSVTTQQTQAVVTIYYHCIVFLLPFNGNSMCNG